MNCSELKILPRRLVVYSEEEEEEGMVLGENTIYSFTVICEKPHIRDLQWSINRNYREFQELENQLLKSKVLNMRRLPSREMMGPDEDPMDRLSLLLDYLTEISQHPLLREHSSLLEFFEISVKTLDHSEKRKEGYVLKRTGGRIVNEQRLLHLAKYFHRLQRRWLFLTSTSICYLKARESGRVKECIPLSISCEVTAGKEDTGYKDGVCVISEKRHLVFRAGSPYKAKEWYKAIKRIIEASSASEIHIERRYASSFPVRNNCTAVCLIDGEDYFREVLSALQQAERDVFITDWWMSPELYLRRPATAETQLQEVLGALADKGVKIRIILYRELALMLYNKSFHTQKVLESRSPNIKVVRHPTRSLEGGELFWTHHEKTIVIDQEVAFMGGFDLCFGRWDTSKHRLFDASAETWPGIDYSNTRIKDYADVERWERNMLDRSREPRMPWHDVGLKLTGEVVKDVTMHFIGVWNHAMTDSTGMYYVLKSMVVPREGSQEGEELSILEPSIEVERLEAMEAQPRTGRFETSTSDSRPSFFASMFGRNKSFKSCRCQLVRSGSGWSLGSPSTENSIYTAYIELITNAKSFIYIENQFFISSTSGEEVKNGVAQALVDRIQEAHRRKEAFLVIVVLPLLPGFEGKVSDPNASVLRAQLFWQYMTINRSAKSMFSQLYNDYGIDPDDYIKFYSLRTYDEAPNGLFGSEIIYVHSKLMIVDDDIALIGSANINDRSLLGDRDSELAIIIEDQKKMDSRMNGEKVRVGKFAHMMRMRLFAEHSLLSPDILTDPLSPDFRLFWDLVARNNEYLYRELFKVSPDNQIGTFQELAEAENVSRLQCSSKTDLSKVSGFLVPFPMHFLEHEDLSLKGLRKERLLNTAVFV